MVWYRFCTLCLLAQADTLDISTRGKNKEQIVSEKAVQDKIYRSSTLRSTSTYVPFNSLTFSDGRVSVEGITTENIAKVSTAWWKKINKNKSTLKPFWQKTIAITSTTKTLSSVKTTTTERTSGLLLNGINSELQLVYSTTKQDYTKRPLLQPHIKNEEKSSPPSIHANSKETPTRRNKPVNSETTNLIKNFFSHATSSATENPGGKKVKWIPEATPNSPLHTSPRPGLFMIFTNHYCHNMNKCCR